MKMGHHKVKGEKGRFKYQFQADLIKKQFLLVITVAPAICLSLLIIVIDGAEYHASRASKNGLDRMSWPRHRDRRERKVMLSLKKILWQLHENGTLLIKLFRIKSLF